MIGKTAIKICFLADKHDLYDDRIYWKMAVPLKKKGYDVHYLLIRDRNEKGITKQGINYEMLKVKTFSKNRYLNFLIKRVNPFNNYKKLLTLAGKLNADVYHFHDLWINRIGKKLKNLPQKPVVFYDAREPYAQDFVSFTEAKGIIKKLVGLFASYIDHWEKRKAKNYDLVISNEEIVRDNFRKKLGNHKAEVIYNFTDIYKNYNQTDLSERKYDFIYCGGITESRGAMKIIEAIKIAKKTIPNITLVFVGRYSPENLKQKLQNFIDSNNLKNNVQLFPFVNYKAVSNFYNSSKVGLIAWLPKKALTIKMPIKIFEYMAFGLPIIGSNFGHINNYIEGDNCGVTVNPDNPNEIAEAMVNLLTNKQKYNEFSENGRKVTLQKYKWELELNRLIGFYNKALDDREKNK
ncbi:glycosyltransferase family 4 protein [Aureibaculum conchae]|uniref:glycosyltransferase family 4 protein n=1 Tax=Aureibaculum sp. 2308TA14-22 TaxID=3108392 RepID=UPI003390F15D